MPLIASALIAGGSGHLPLPLTVVFLTGLLVCLAIWIVIQRDGTLLSIRQWYLTFTVLGLSFLLAYAGRGLHALWIAPALMAGLQFSEDRHWAWGLWFGGIGLIVIGLWQPSWFSIPSVIHDGDGSIIVSLSDTSAVWRRVVDIILLVLAIEGCRLWLDDDLWRQLYGTILLGFWIVGAAFLQSTWVLLAGALSLTVGLWIFVRYIEHQIGFFRQYIGTLLIGGGGILGAIFLYSDLGFHPNWLGWIEFPLRQLAWNAVSSPDNTTISVLQSPQIVAVFAGVCGIYAFGLLKTDSYQPEEEFVLTSPLYWSGFGLWCCTVGTGGLDPLLWYLVGRTIAQAEKKPARTPHHSLRLAGILAGLWMAAFLLMTPTWIYEMRLHALGGNTIEELRGQEWIFKRSDIAPAKAYLELRDKIKIVHSDTGEALLPELQKLVNQISAWPDLAPWAWKILADAAFISRKADLYLQSLQKVIESEFSSSQLLEYCGDKLSIHSSPENAIPAYEKAAYKNPYNPELRRKLAHCYRQARRPNDAEQQEQAILTLEGTINR